MPEGISDEPINLAQFMEAGIGTQMQRQHRGFQ
jgi:hypothetical protein